MTDRRLLATALSTLLLAAACGAPVEDAPPADETTIETVEVAAPSDPLATELAAGIAEAHGRDAWYAHDGFRSALAVDFGGNRVLEGTMTFTPDAGETRIERADGSVALFDGETAWVSPAEAEFPMARFHVLTWPYFAAVPMKLSDPGTRLESLGELPLGGRPHPAARLTFDTGVGDTPDDWYVLYRDPDSGRLAAMAYIVTFGTTTEEAEAEPHAITYGGWQEIDGVQVPTAWDFWLWDEERGTYGEPIGHVELTDPAFVTPEPAAFTAPGDAREAELPAAG